MFVLLYAILKLQCIYMNDCKYVPTYILITTLNSRMNSRPSALSYTALLTRWITPYIPTSGFISFSNIEYWKVSAWVLLHSHSRFIWFHYTGMSPSWYIAFWRYKLTLPLPSALWLFSIDLPRAYISIVSRHKIY